MKLSLLLTSFLTLALLCVARPKDDAPIIQFSPDDTLHIEVIDNLYMKGYGERDRFRRIKKTIEEVFEDVDFPMNYEIERFGSRRTPPGQPRLDITIMRWGDNGMHEVEARFSARIKRDYDQNRLGIFFARDAVPLGSYSRMIRVHDQVMQNAIAKMVYELNSRLPMGEDPEVQSESEPPDDVSQPE